jgi:hypothetical protein
VAHLLRLSAALVLSALAACGGKSFEAGEPDPTPGGTSPGGSGQGGSGSTAGTQAGGSTGKGGTGSAGTGQGGSAGSTCEGFDDEPGYFVGVVIMNKTSAPIHLGQDMVDCTVGPVFAVQNGSGAPLPSPGNCRSTCEALRTNGPVGCPAICAFPSSTVLQPGEVLYTSYSGLYDVQINLPQHCVDPDYGVAQCSQTKQIQPGTFTFSARAGSSIDCSETTGVCNACMASGGGGCTTPGSLISGKMRSATATVFLDSSYGVFGGYPAPAPAFPGDPDGDSSGAAIALRNVELVFTD